MLTMIHPRQVFPVLLVLSCILLALAFSPLLLAETAKVFAGAADAASEEILIDEVLLGRQLSLRVYVEQVKPPPPSGRRITADPRRFPRPRFHGQVRVVVFDLEQQADRVASRYSTSHERDGWETRVVLAEWARDGSLVVLYTAGKDVILNRFMVAGEPRVEGRKLFERGRRIPMVWDVVRAAVIDLPDEPDKLVVNLTVRRSDGGLNDIPVERDLAEVNGAWRFDSRLMGGIMEADAVIDWERLLQDRQENPRPQ